VLSSVEFLKREKERKREKSLLSIEEVASALRLLRLVGRGFRVPGLLLAKWEEVLQQALRIIPYCHLLP